MKKKDFSPVHLRTKKIAQGRESKAKRLVELIAKQYWIDAGYDAGAAVIPFVPAGVSKVVKGGTKVAKGLGEVSSTRKGLKNADAIAEG